MSRIVSIDFAKGTLVLLMVVYHSLNYLQYGTLPHDILIFLPPSFIMITGFIVSHMYIRKYEGNLRTISLRLCVRSLKIFLLFVALNVAARHIWSVNHYGVALHLDNFKNELIQIFLIGVPWISAFDILLPISYTLATAIIVVRVQSILPYFSLILAVSVFLLCILLENLSLSIYNLNMLSAGFIGMAVGLLPQGILGRIRPSLAFVAALIVLYIILYRIIEDHYFTQMLFTVFALAIIFSIGSRIDPKSLLTRQVVLVGRYSLLSYIIQIFFLQLLNPIASVFNIQTVHPLALISIVMVMTFFSVLMTNYARHRIIYINVLYNAIFS